MKVNKRFSKTKYFNLIFLVVSPLVFLSLLLAFPQEKIQNEVSVVNIEVPVRVFKGNTFIDNLGIDDFEIYENGELQKIEAVYLIKKTAVEEKEGKEKAFNPDVSRRFVLVFELQEYLPKLKNVVSEFFNRVISPGDSLHIITPVDNYNFKKETFSRLPKDKIIDQLVSILKKDMNLGNSEYRSMLRHLEDIFSLNIDADTKKSMYLDTARKLRDMKYFNEQNLGTFSDFLKTMEGQKHVFIFYQKELIPLLPGLDPFSIAELRRDVSFDIKKVRRIFSDSSISVHFLFVSKKPGMYDELDVGRMMPLRVELMDQSYSLFNSFKEISSATGGIADSSANPMASFQKAVTATENYYLIYYCPKDYTPDGEYRKIKVTVKNKKYRLTYRNGYYAN